MIPASARRLCKKISFATVAPLACALLMIFPSVMLFSYVRAFGVNVVFWDDWEMIPVFQRAMSGLLSVSDLLAQHNEHRMPIPKLVMVAIGNLTHYDTVAVMLFSWVLICLTCALLFYLYRKQYSWNGHFKHLLIFLPVVLLLFNFRQWQSLLWAITNQIYLMIFAVVATFALLEISRKIDGFLFLGFLSAAVASFSFLAGLAVWPVGFLQMIISDRERKLRDSALWCSVAGAAFITYFWGYAKPSYLPPLDSIFKQPLAAAGYYLAFVGSPVVYGDTAIAQAIGIGLVLIGIIIIELGYRKGLLRNNRVWLSLILFAFISSVIVTVGRSGLGLEQAMASRYTPITVLGIIGLYFLAVSTSKKLPTKSKSFSFQGTLVLLLVVIVAAYIVGCCAGWYEGQRMKSSREMGAYILKTNKIQSDENIKNYLYISPEVVRERAIFLEENGLNVFSEPCIDTSELALIGSDTFCALETINGVVTSETSGALVVNSSQHETLTITGWAVDKQANDAASAVFLVIDDSHIIPTVYGLAKPDVASHFNNRNFRLSGFVATFSSSILCNGEHDLTLKIVSKDRRCYYQKQLASLVVT